MYTQQLEVKKVLWHDTESGQMSVEFQTISGQKFVCFVDGGHLEVGKPIEIASFYYLEASETLEGIFERNLDQEKHIEQIGEWNVFIKGQIVGIEGSTLLVDCGNVIFPLKNMTTDSSVIGEWIGVTLERLEAELA